MEVRPLRGHDDFHAFGIDPGAVADAGSAGIGGGKSGGKVRKFGFGGVKSEGSPNPGGLSWRLMSNASF
jgi:hypothetical protein